MSGNIDGADSYTPPLGLVKIWAKRAIDVKNVESALGGKSDPYLRVLVANHVLARTEVINNNLNPEWDQMLYIAIHSLKDTIVFEAMDYQHLTRVRYMKNQCHNF